MAGTILDSYASGLGSRTRSRWSAPNGYSTIVATRSTGNLPENGVEVCAGGVRQVTRDYTTNYGFVWSQLHARKWEKLPKGQVDPKSKRHGYKLVKDAELRRIARSRYFGLDYGSPFYSRTDVLSVPQVISTSRTIPTNPVFQQDFTGPVVASEDFRRFIRYRGINNVTGQPISNGDTGVPNMDVMIAYGSAGIARTLPSVPQASIAAFLGELREGLPRIVGAAALKDHALHSVGDEYLNVVFGILPTIGDLQKIAKASKNYDDFQRGWAEKAAKGKIARRAVSLAKVESTNTTTPGPRGPYGYHGYGANMAAGTGWTTTTIHNEAWFSGAYRVEPPSPTESQFQKLRELTYDFGLVPDITTAWQLTPWSWLLDWVVNFDDFLTNFSYMGKKGVSLSYGYVMCKTITTREEALDTRYQRYGGGEWIPLYLRDRLTTTTLQRRRASALGFGVSFDTLSPKQLAILAALGISRASF